MGDLWGVFNGSILEKSGHSIPRTCCNTHTFLLYHMTNDVKNHVSLRVLCKGDPLISFPSKGPETRSLDVCFVVNMSLNKQLCCRWFGTLWPPMWCHYIEHWNTNCGPKYVNGAFTPHATMLLMIVLFRLHVANTELCCREMLGNTYIYYMPWNKIKSLRTGLMSGSLGYAKNVKYPKLSKELYETIARPSVWAATSAH